MTIEYQASDALIKAAERGPHKGWTTFDIKGEGALFQELHDLLSRPDFVAQDADKVVHQISQMVQSYGYATRDSHLHQLGGVDPAELEGMFENADTQDDRTHLTILLYNQADDEGGFVDGDYFHEISQSLMALKEISAAAADFIANANVYSRLHEAYIAGMKLKDDEVEAQSTPAP